MSALALAGKVAIVTGASRSIGASISRRLAQDGARVVINFSRDSKSADEVVAVIEKDGKGSAVAIQADLSTSAGRQHLVNETVKKWGKIDILVNNAGIMGSKPLDQIDEAFFDAHYDINVKGPLFLTQAVVPHMGPGSRVIFTSTSLTANSNILPNALVYVSSKAAVDQFTRILAKDLAKKDITVNAISPGPSDTPLFRAGKPDSVIAAISAQSPWNRLGRSEDMRGVVAFLAGPESAWISGQNIHVNGAAFV